MKKRAFAQNKLWRDKAPALMEKMGSVIHVKPLSDQEYDQELKNKLIEEAQEVVAAADTKELASELADLFEAIDALCVLHNVTKDEIAIIQEKKRAERGGFFERQFVTIAEHGEGSYGEKYCLASPQKYPEIK